MHITRDAAYTLGAAEEFFTGSELPSSVSSANCMHSIEAAVCMTVGVLVIVYVITARVYFMKCEFCVFVGRQGESSNISIRAKVELRRG